MHERFTLNVLQDFRCVGSQCVRTCCQGPWRLDVDEPAYLRWQKLSAAGESLALLDGIVTTDDNRRHLRLRADGKCTFLDCDGLCQVHAKLGHEVLPSVCQNFPKDAVGVPERSYRVASFACPEIVRLVFAQNGETMSRETIANYPPPAFDERRRGEEIKLGFDDIVREILAFRQLAPGIRVFFLSAILAELFKVQQQGELTRQHFEQTKKILPAAIQEIGGAANASRLEPDPVTAGSYWQVVFQLCKTRNVDARFFGDETNPLHASLLRGEDKFDDYRQIYTQVKDCVTAFRQQLGDRFDQGIEHFLDAYFIAQGFPLLESHFSLSIVYTKCVSGLAMLQLLLWLQYQQSGTLSRDDLEATIVEVHRKFVHTNSVCEHLAKDENMTQIGKYCLCFLDLFF